MQIFMLLLPLKSGSSCQCLPCAAWSAGPLQDWRSVQDAVFQLYYQSRSEDGRERWLLPTIKYWVYASPIMGLICVPRTRENAMYTMPAVHVAPPGSIGSQIVRANVVYVAIVVYQCLCACFCIHMVQWVYPYNRGFTRICSSGMPNTSSCSCCTHPTFAPIPDRFTFSLSWALVLCDHCHQLLCPRLFPFRFFGGGRCLPLATLRHFRRRIERTTKLGVQLVVEAYTPEARDVHAQSPEAVQPGENFL